jgi:hypothetical protein
MQNEGELLRAVETRNYLAHHFLREFLMAVPSQKNLHDASSQLADLSVWLEELDAELDAHLASLGIETASSIDAEAMALADSLRPENGSGSSPTNAPQSRDPTTLWTSRSSLRRPKRFSAVGHESRARRALSRQDVFYMRVKRQLVLHVSANEHPPASG